MKTIKYVTLAACLFLLSGLFLYFCKSEQERGLQFLSQQEYLAFLSDYQEVASAPPGVGTLQISGIDAPFDAAGMTYYVPETLRGGADDLSAPLNWSDSFHQVFLYWDPALSKEELIRGNVALPLFICLDDTTYVRRNLVLTGLPMLVLNSDSVRDTLYGGEGDHGGELTIFDPGGDYYSVEKLYVQFRLRGSSTIAIQMKDLENSKRQYEMDLLDRQGQRASHALLGFDPTDKLRLNAMLQDPYSIRNAFGMALWNDLCNSIHQSELQTGQHAYVEFVENSSYQGLFGIMRDPQIIIDRDTQQTYSDVFKVKGNIWPDGTLTPLYTIVSVLYPELTDLAHGLDPLKRALAPLEAGGGQDFPDLSQAVDLENAVYFGLFTDLLAAYDNLYCNFYLLCHLAEDEVSYYQKIPWDIDRSLDLMQTWPNQEASAREAYYPFDVQTLLDAAPDQMGSLLAEEWFDLRDNVFSDEHLTALMDTLVAELTDSGAYLRESDRWDKTAPMEELERITDFLKFRLNNRDIAYQSMLQDNLAE